MSDFVILTDSSADLSEEIVQQQKIQVLPLTVTIGGQDYRDWPDHRELDPHQFYDRLRKGEVATTAGVNVASYIEALEPLLQSGKDVLILAFSSGLSTTCNSAVIAAKELGEKYPDRKIFAVDTLCASLGQGLLVWLCSREKERGKSLEALRDYAEQTKGRICHWFTVDDLNHLKRGGRVSATAALFGTMLSVKPVLHVDDQGRLIPMEKCRGRRAALLALVDHMEKTASDPANQTVFLSHGDCLEDAEFVAEEIRRRFGTKDIRIGYIGPVIGSHTGAGVVALFFLGGQR